jgi:oligopeptide/dipeptide ABC transporter ATP-binding protein
VSLVEIERLEVRHGKVRAVDDVSLSIAEGETLGLVGESGCGKSTLGRALLRLVDPQHGTIRFDGVDVTAMSQRALRPLRRKMQMVFQDPYASLNPRMRVEDLIGEALDVHRLVDGKEARAARVGELLKRVGLSDEARAKYPHELSGGMRQRVGIARALAVEPKLLICDEPVSALDASVRAQVVNLLADLRDDLGLTLLFIAHDLAVVRHLSQRVAVMYLGKIVEIGPAAEVFSTPRHPYTRLLLSSAPRVDVDGPRREGVRGGEPASARAIPSGCRFRTRCPEVEAKCAEVEPPLLQIGAVAVACIHAK